MAIFLWFFEKKLIFKKFSGQWCFKHLFQVLLRLSDSKYIQYEYRWKAQKLLQKKTQKKSVIFGVNFRQNLFKAIDFFLNISQIEQRKMRTKRV
jgi:hypothetical protein